MEEQKDALQRDVEEEEEMQTGPMSILYHAVKTGEPILVHCRNDRKLCGRLKMFDRHFNMILLGVEEIWSAVPRSGKGRKKATAAAVPRQRFISRLFLRGDSVILVVRDPLRLAASSKPSAAPAVAAPPAAAPAAAAGGVSASSAQGAPAAGRPAAPMDVDDGTAAEPAGAAGAGPLR
eukprot:TRINITY_DN6415_c0_g1_i1.p2 TRINITY_DN6415_c0_g1~~TRINITY_DN6415_c0_g1_i1.p2  ORF type:complete len:178 (-),score=18.59 TRINITY_DN6415_c0_g1_i1:115-648(-)